MTRAAKAIALGKSFVGKIRYKLGAKCPPGKSLSDCKELDCSGFIRELLREVGVSIPDGSQQQRAACRAVPLDLALGSAGAGCLLFMSPKPGQSWPRHVGLSIGNGESLECCSDAKGIAILNRTLKGRRWQFAGKIDALFIEENESCQP